MSIKNINFNNKKINTNNSYKSKKLLNIHGTDTSKILIFKKEPYGKKIHSNTILDIMTTITLNHYVYIMYKDSSNDWIY